MQFVSICAPVTQPFAKISYRCAWRVNQVWTPVSVWRKLTELLVLYYPVACAPPLLNLIAVPSLSLNQAERHSITCLYHRLSQMVPSQFWGMELVELVGTRQPLTHEKFDIPGGIGFQQTKRSIRRCFISRINSKYFE